MVGQITELEWIGSGRIDLARGESQPINSTMLAELLAFLAKFNHLERAEPVLLASEPGTGKTHLATGIYEVNPGCPNSIVLKERFMGVLSERVEYSGTPSERSKNLP